MSDAPRSSAPWMTPTLAIGLVLVSAFSLLAFLALSAFAPQLRPDSSGGANALSRSAIGFAGFRTLLDEAGGTTIIDRGVSPATRAGFGLTILTPELLTAPSELASAARQGPHVIVLPKWLVVNDPAHAGWVMKVDAIVTDEIAKMLSALSKSTTIARRKSAATIALSWNADEFAPKSDMESVKIDSMQTIGGKDWEAIVTDDKGKIVIAHLKDTGIYVLADPDLMNTQGLRQISAARASVMLVNDVRQGASPVAFDVTLNGFRRSPDLLREAFSPPFLGATLCALLAAALIGFHAMSRFASPLAPARAYGFGKRALADSTAGLIRMLGREDAMAPRYAQAMRTLVLRRLGAPRESGAAESWLSRAEVQAGADANFSELFAQSARARTLSDVIGIARALYRWKQGILHERR